MPQANISSSGSGSLYKKSVDEMNHQAVGTKSGLEDILIGNLSGLAIQKAADVARMVRLDQRKYIVETVANLSCQSFPDTEPSAGSLLASFLAFSEKSCGPCIYDQYEHAKAARRAAAERVMANAILGDHWENDDSLAVDQLLIKRMLAAPVATLPTAEVLVRIAEDLADAKFDFLERYFVATKIVPNRIASSRKCKRRGPSQEVTVAKGSRGGNITTSSVYKINHLDARILELWLDPDRPLWLMTRPAGVVLMRLELPEEEITDANYAKYLQRLKLKPVPRPPIRNVVTKRDPFTTTNSFSKFVFKRSVKLARNPETVS